MSFFVQDERRQLEPMLKCKKIFYISVDIYFVTTYNKSEEIEGGHRNEV
jgi:hypothetical protein